MKFESSDEKENFIEKLEQFLGKIGIGRQRLEVNPNHIWKQAFTKADRQAQLEKFFRVVFSQVVLSNNNISKYTLFHFLTNICILYFVCNCYCCTNFSFLFTFEVFSIIFYSYVMDSFLYYIIIVM